MRILVPAIVLLAAPLGAQLLGPPGDRGPRAHAGPAASTNAAPVLASDLAADAHVFIREILTFEVNASDPEGGPLTLRLLNPPPGLATDTDTSTPGSVTCHYRWLVPESFGGMQRLVFEARDAGKPPAVARLALDVRVSGWAVTSPYWENRHMQVGDVTGDGVLDIVATSSTADVGGVLDAGAVYVFAGGAVLDTAPRATLTVPGAQPQDLLGDEILRLGDVSGDGILDIVVATSSADVQGISDLGAVYFWKGGAALTGGRSPDATLFDASTGAGARMCRSSGQGLHLVELTGDGVLDLVTVTHLADVNGVQDAGALHVWAGGASLSGFAEPTARLVRAAPRPSDRIGHTGFNEAVLFGDVTGNGALDVVASAPFATGDAGLLTGALFVWQGGAGLSGTVAPRAVLEGRFAQDQLGSSAFGRSNGFLLVDVTADGLLDVLTASTFADTPNAMNAGAGWLWKGGPGLAEKPAPTATFVVPGGKAGERFGGAWIEAQADVTGDGLTDVILGGSRVDDFVGAVYVWAGGPGLTGIPAPTAKLAGSGAFVQMTSSPTVGAGGHPGVYLRELTGDGVLDLVAISSGDTFVWNGGAILTGTPAPLATLVGPHPRADRGIQFGDVTGDGLVDIVTANPYADGFLFPYLRETGRVTVFSGADLSGTVNPSARLMRRGAQAYDNITDTEQAQGPNFLLADVTGDGLRDVLAGSRDANASATDSGALHVWEGGPALAGNKQDATRLTVDISGAELTSTLNGTTFQLVDLDGDGLVDPLTTAGDLGITYLWKGGPTLLGDPAPLHETLVDTSGIGELVHVADVTGDGTLDLLCVHTWKDVGSLSRVGAIRVWPGPLPAATSIELFVPTAATNDGLAK